LDTRDRTADLRALELRRAAAMLRDALMVVLSITRRAGIMFRYVLILLTGTDYSKSTA
jgi:hypothetical protein